MREQAVSASARVSGLRFHGPRGVSVSGRGEVYSFSTVRQAPNGFSGQVPYVSPSSVWPRDRCRQPARLGRAGAGGGGYAARNGDPPAERGRSQGIVVYGYKFRPVLVPTSDVAVEPSPTSGRRCSRVVLRQGCPHHDALVLEASRSSIRFPGLGPYVGASVMTDRAPNEQHEAPCAEPTERLEGTSGPGRWPRRDSATRRSAFSSSSSRYEEPPDPGARFEIGRLVTSACTTVIRRPIGRGARTMQRTDGSWRIPG